uniref:BESS domain-containing protein n=1 Tax=Rhodnius prolixus TaxID=13249 RepID=T1HJD0_RHOPR
MELLEKTQAPKDPEPINDDISFFNSLLPFVRSLLWPNKLLCRMQIQELVYSFVTNTRDQIFAP